MEYRNTIINYIKNNFKLFLLLFSPLIIAYILEATQNTDTVLFTILFIYKLVLSGTAFILIGLPFSRLFYKHISPKLERLRKIKVKSKNIFLSKTILLYFPLVGIFYILIPILFSITLLILIPAQFDIDLFNTYFTVLPIFTTLLIPYVFNRII